MQELRKLNNEGIRSVPKIYLDGVPHVLAKHTMASENYQCKNCSFFKTNEECPSYKNSEGADDLYCNADFTEVWQREKDVVKVFIEPSAKPLEASVGRKYDAGKPMYALMPEDAEEEVVKALTVGALRYNEPINEENWRKVDNPFFRYYSAARRHMKSDRRGELIDVDKVNKDGSISKGTGCYHLACAIASLMFMLQLKMENNPNE